MGQTAEQNRTKIEWCEPWSLEMARERILAFQKEMPPLWRMLIYVIVIPLMGMLAIRWVFPEESGWGEMLKIMLAFALIHVALFVMVLIPSFITLDKKGITLLQCGGQSYIKLEQIRNLHFETQNGKRYFVICAKNKYGKTFKQQICMPDKGISEQDVILFLYEMGIPHLFRYDSHDFDSDL